MTPTPQDYLRASTHLHQAHDNALIEFSTAHLIGAISDVYRRQCVKHLTEAAEVLGFKLVPAIPQPVPAMDTPTKEAAHEVIVFPSPKSKPGAPSELGVGHHEEE